MRDANVCEPFAVSEIFVDGFTNHEIHNGVMSCVGYRLQPQPSGEPLKVVVIRLVWPAAATDDAIVDAQSAQVGAPLKVARPERPRRH